MFIHLKDTSERVTRRWDKTSWQEASEFLYVKTPPFDVVQQTKQSPEKNRNAPCDALLMSHFQNFAAGRQKKTDFGNRASRGFI